MKILVTGATGFIGKFLINSLKQHDVNVVGIGRQLVSSNADIFFAVPDLNINGNLDAIISGCDVVIHLAARVHVMDDIVANPIQEYRKVNVEGTLNLARESAKAGVKRFIYISSIGVNGETSELPFTENDQPKPHNPYSCSKFEAEQGLNEMFQGNRMEVVIIRPPLVYGAYAPGNFASLMRVIKMGIPLPLGAICNKRSFVYVENLVSLIITCINHPSAANQVFLVSDGNDLSTTELLRSSASALGVKSRLVPVPQKLIEFCAATIGKKEVAQRLCGNLQVDITKASTLLDWMPPITVEEGLKATAIGFNQVDK